MKRVFLSAALIVAFAAICGCRDAGLSGLVPFEGVLTVDGEPTEGVTITFLPAGDDAANRRSAVAVTKSDGSFSGVLKLIPTAKRAPVGR